jgi:hypothetical protein
MQLRDALRADRYRTYAIGKGNVTASRRGRYVGVRRGGRLAGARRALSGEADVRVGAGADIGEGALSEPQFLGAVSIQPLSLVQVTGVLFIRHDMA